MVKIIFVSRNNNSNAITRFIGLGDYYDKMKKEKWLYGFVLSPQDSTSVNKLDYTVTESPYSDSSQYVSNMLPVSKQYFYNTSSNGGQYSNNGVSKKRKLNGPAFKQCQYL